MVFFFSKFDKRKHSLWDSNLCSPQSSRFFFLCFWIFVFAFVFFVLFFWVGKDVSFFCEIFDFFCSHDFLLNC